METFCGRGCTLAEARAATTELLIIDTCDCPRSGLYNVDGAGDDGPTDGPAGMLNVGL